MALDSARRGLELGQQQLGGEVATQHRHLLWAFAGAVLLVVLVYALLRQTFSRGKRGLHADLETVRAAQRQMEETNVKLDGQMVSLLEGMMEAQQAGGRGGDTDHSLALKVADEIVRIETNLAHMDPSIKGHKQLSKGVERIRNNFLANGYEMVSMLGRPYDENMKAVASFETDEELEPGQRVITRVIKPQVNYKGKQIQAAQIVVSQNIE